MSRWDRRQGPWRGVGVGLRSGFELFLSLASGCRVAWSGRVVFGFEIGLRIGCRVWVWSGSGVGCLRCGWVRA